MFFLISLASFSSSVFDIAPQSPEKVHPNLISLAERMLRSRVAALAHLRREYPCGLPHIFRQRRVLLDELGGELIIQAQHVVEHEYLSVARGPGANADRRDRERLRDLRRERCGHELQHHRESTGVLECDRIRLQSPCRRLIATLDPMAAEGVHRLGREAEVPHDRYPYVYQSPHRSGHRLPAFDLHRMAIGLFHRARSEEHTSELQSRLHLVCRLLLEKKKTPDHNIQHTYQLSDEPL